LTPEVLAEPVLVGREHELETLHHYLDLVVQGKGTTVLVSGEAGSGKTRLVNEFLSASKRKKNTTQLKGWCLSNSGVPYFPFIEAFNVYSSDYNNKEVPSGTGQGVLEESLEGAELVAEEEMGLRAWLMGPGKTEKSRELEDLSPQAWKESTFAAVTRALFAISAKKPTLLFIDDLHWADTASLALLQYISRFILSQRILVLGTFRKEDLNPDSEGHPHPLVEALRLMGRENLYKEIKLPSLRSPDVSLLAENIVGGRVQTELAEKLAVESQGNPLFVVESLKMLSETGNLVQENDRWRVSGEIGIPSKVKDILLRRIDVLKPAERKMLEVASVIGSQFDPELLGAVMALDNVETLETLGAVAKASSLVIFEGSNYRFDHAKVRDALYEEIAPPLQKAYHGKVAEKLESIWKGEKLPVGDLAFHYAQAEKKEKAIKYSLAAGEDALKIYSGAEAIKHFEYVLDVTAEDTKYTNERATAMEGLGDSLFARGRMEEAVKMFERLSSSNASDLVKMRALRKAIFASSYLGDYAHGLEMAKKAAENPELDLLESARTQFYKAFLIGGTGQFRENFEAVKKSLKVMEQEYSLSDMAEMLVFMVPMYMASGQLKDAIAAGLRARALSEYSKAIDRRQSASFYLCLAFTAAGLEKEGLETSSEAIKASEKISDPVSRAWTQTMTRFFSSLMLENLAAAKLFSGLPLENMQSFGVGAKLKFFMSGLISGALRDFKQGLKAAIAESLKGAESAEETDSYFSKSFNYSNLMRQYAQLGDMEEAEKYYRKTAKIFDETSLSLVMHQYANYLLSKAIYFSCKSQWMEANPLYEKTLEIYTRASAENMILAGARQAYCWALLQQGRFADAKMQYEIAKETMKNLEKRFDNSEVLGYFVAPARVKADEEFSMRLDLVNVAKDPGLLIKVEELVPAEFTLINIRPKYNTQNGSIELEKKNIKPFTDEVITLTVKGTKAGVFSLKPRLVYTNELGETKTCMITTLNVTVQPTPKSD
jgi:tetratricopeptide (TPR) repeat protein